MFLRARVDGAMLSISPGRHHFGLCDAQGMQGSEDSCRACGPWRLRRGYWYWSLARVAGAADYLVASCQAGLAVWWRRFVPGRDPDLRSSQTGWDARAGVSCWGSAQYLGEGWCSALRTCAVLFSNGNWRKPQNSTV